MSEGTTTRFPSLVWSQAMALAILSVLLLAGNGPTKGAEKSKAESSAQQAPVGNLALAAAELGKRPQRVSLERAVDAAIPLLAHRGWALKDREQQESGEILSFHRDEARLYLAVAPQEPAEETLRFVRARDPYNPAEPVGWPKSGERMLLHTVDRGSSASLTLFTGHHFVDLDGPSEAELYEVAEAFMSVDGSAPALGDRHTIGLPAAGTLLAQLIADGWSVEKRERWQNRESASLRRVRDTAWYEIKREKSVESAWKAFESYWMRMQIGPTRLPKIGHKAMLWVSMGHDSSSLFFYRDRYFVALVGFPENEALQSARKLLRLLATK